MERAAQGGRSDQVWGCVRRLAGKRRAMKEPSKTRDGQELRSAEHLADEWAGYAETKFARTVREAERGEWAPLPARAERRTDVPSDADLELCLRAMAKGKAVGADGIAVEAFRA